MKAYNILIIAALMMLAGCTEDTTSTFVNRSGGITAKVENGMEKTRSTMIDSPMQRIDFNWEQGDIIGVFDSENKNALFSATEITDNGSTAVFKSDGNLPQGAFTAYYPYSDDAQYSSGNVLTLTMPAVQNYVERDYKAQPDASANIMVGQGFTNSVTFKNVFAILKIGYVASSEDAVQRIVFSDLSGHPVSGAFTVTMDDGVPSAVFPSSGDGTSIALSCGGGVTVKPDDIVTFYLVVPAREYAKGFKLDFELASGSTDSRTIGTRAGKTLLRSMVYSVGDVSVITKKDYTVDFGEAGGVIMDDDMMAMVMSINDLGFMDFDDEMGNCYEIVMKQGAGLKVGQTLVINRISEALPHGLIGRVSEIVPVNGADVIRVLQYSDASKAFKSLVIGKTDAVNNDDGSVNEEAMVPLDLSRHFSYFEPAPDTDLEVSYAGDGLKIGGQIDIGDVTRATGSVGVTTPHLSFKFKDDDERNNLTIGATASLSLAVGASVSDYSLNYIAGSITPSVKFDFVAQRKAETKPLTASKKLGRFHFGAVTIGPLVAEPFVDISLFVTLQGYAEVTATWDYTLGANVGFSFIRYYTGDERDWGLLGRLSNRSSDLPNLSFSFPDEISTSFGAEVQAGAQLKVGLSFYRLIYIGNDLKLGVSLKAALDLTTKARGMLNAGLSMSPLVEGKISANNKTFDLVALEFDPLWYRYFYPEVRAIKADGAHKLMDPETTKFPFLVALYGRTITDMKINYEIYRRPVGSTFTFSAEKISEHFLDYYQSSSVLPGGVQAPYDKLEFNPTFDLKIKKGYVYTIIFRCIPTDSRSPIPAYFAPAENDNKIEIWRDTEKFTQSDGTQVERDVILINDDQAYCEKGEDGIWYVHQYR